MAVKALLFGVDDLYPLLRHFYKVAVQCGYIEVVGYVSIENDGIQLHYKDGGGGG